ncbi:MAG: 2-hydroxyacyl-CoA dehydratase family protein [Dehalococcoidia bacterium]|nr:2-hydroxyacyl-CoA dehydratase family protein [Dehalococcoidia bacterium]
MISKAALGGKRVLRSSIAAGRARKEYWGRVKEAKRTGRPVVAAFGLLPREIWHAMDVPVLNPEGLALEASVRRLSGKYCEEAEQHGFARELCAVHTSLLGIAGAHEVDPQLDGMFVKPDLIIGSSFACMSESKSFLYWVEQFGCPYHVVDVPINKWGNRVGTHAVRYFAEELKGMIAFLECHGFSYDVDRMKESVRNSRRTMELWSEIEECRKSVPAPMTAVDALVSIGNTLIYLLGTEICVDLFRGLLEEVKARVSNGEGIIDNERLRLYLVGIPPLYNLALLDYPSKYGAALVKCDLDFFGGSRVEADSLDPEAPIESVASKQLADIVNPCYASKVSDSVRTVKEYRVDGVIGLNKRGCRNFPASLRLVKDAIMRETGIPMAVFDLDGIDSREYNDAHVKANLDSFMETLVRTKAGG